MTYGLPYKGSKSKIAKQIVGILPSAKYFVDLFCGGCAVTHAAMLSGKYKEFIVNDISPGMSKMFKDAILGKYKNESRVIPREEFHRLKSTDPYVATCWSFGNNGREYIWGEGISDIKLIVCKMLYSSDLYTRYSAYREFMRKVSLYHNSLQDSRIEIVERLNRIQSLENLNRIQDCITTNSVSYSEVKIPNSAVVYCDPPYKGTNKYNCEAFDYDKFYDWLRSQPFPVYVSEYAMPDDFISVWSAKKTCCYSATNNSKQSIEHIFVHKKFEHIVHQP